MYFTLLTYSLCVLRLVSSMSVEDHAIYVSVLEIDHQEMKVKVFMDDLNDAIRNDSSSIEEYFQKKINLQTDDESVIFSFQEVTEEGEIYWITFKLEMPEEHGLVNLKADYLMELFPDQTNVVKVNGKQSLFFKLDKSNPSCHFSF